MGKRRSNKPITKKKNAGGEYNGFRYGLASMQGWRQTMEDAHRVSLTLPGEMRDCAFAGVFDGHAGGKTSIYTSKNLLKKILRNLLKDRVNLVSQNSTSSENQELIKSAIINGFLKLDNTMRKSKKVDDNSGTTAVCVFITRSHFYFANCGDSRAIFCRGEKIHFATKDHKPTKKTEEKRIKAAGGDVRRNRVNGRLALSRALGDFEYKSNTSKGQCEQMVSPQPEITIIERNNETDQFIVLACDGVFDVMSNHELVSFVRNQMAKSTSIKAICNNTIDECLKKGSHDNISMILLTLPGCPKHEDICRKRKQDFNEMHCVIRSKKAKVQIHIHQAPCPESERVATRTTSSDDSASPSLQEIPMLAQEGNNKKTIQIPSKTRKNTIGKNVHRGQHNPNAFILYFLEYWKKNGGNICQAAKICGESWGRLANSIKLNYRRRYLRARRKTLMKTN